MVEIDEIKIIELPKDSPCWDQIESLFLQLYKYMSSNGLRQPLAKDGEKLWLSTVQKTSGRLNLIMAAIINSRVIGFAQGTIRLTPNYLGSRKVGFIPHVYVLSEYRKLGIGKKLVTELNTWFKHNKTHSLELQVLYENHAATTFWEKIGFEKELLQMRKLE